MLQVRATQWLNLLTAAIVAVWPAASVSACCCFAGAAPHPDGACPSGCCAADAAACSLATLSADADFQCCPSAVEQESCGCGHECGVGPVARDLSGPSQPWRKFTAPPLSFARHDPQPDLTLEFGVTGSAAPILPRPVRILFGVWRN